MFTVAERLSSTPTISKEFSLQVLKIIYKTRLMDDKMSNLVKQNKGTTFFLSVKGHEIIGAVAALSMQEGKDWALPYYRDRAFAVGLGCPLEEIFAAFLARDIKTHSGGRMMPDHFSDKKRRIPCQSSVVGSQYLQAVGLAMSIKFRKGDEVVYVSGGDGSTSQGEFHEALNFASIHQLPVLFVVQDNGLAISTSSKEQSAGGSVAEMVTGYPNMGLFVAHGSEYEKLVFNFSEAVDRARKFSQPSVLIVKVPRLEAHSNSDDARKYRDEAQERDAAQSDPLIHLEKYLFDNGIISFEESEELKLEIKEEVQRASLEAEKVPFPLKTTATEHIFKEFKVEDSEGESDVEIVMLDALNRALEEEMERDPNVVVFGQDVAHGKGGVFGITKKLSEKFGYRCFNTPLSEATIIGLAIGLSFDGLHRPVAEIQFMDYSWTGVNQIINELASIHYRSKGMWNCPVVVRMTYGGYIQGGPYHSQSIESIFTHIPGLKVVIPSNASDAKRLLKTAILDPNPVIFLEHKALYRQKFFSSRKEPLATSLLPFGKAKIVKEGESVTVLAWGFMVLKCFEVVQELERENISVELIDLRTLVPLDMNTILTSLKKTSKVLIVHEANKTSGFGAELSARIVEEGFQYLDAPVFRLGAKDAPVAYCKDLEDAILPQKEEIKEKIIELCNY